MIRILKLPSSITRQNIPITTIAVFIENKFGGTMAQCATFN
jgi:hypothetical protein